MAIQIQHHPADYDGQFILSTHELPADPCAGGPHGGTRVPMPSLFLRVHPGLPALPVSDSAGRPLGALLGHPIDLEAGRLLRAELRLNAAWPDGGDPDAFVDAHILRLGGGFAFILDVPGARRLYMDAAGCVPAVHCPERRIAASTAPLALGPAAPECFDSELHAALGVLHEGWFPAGLTAHRGAQRILGGRVLDLDAWRLRRVWPKGPIAPAPRPEDAVARIARNVRVSVDAARRAGPTVLCLTAGGETRFMLAACREIAQELEFVTIGAPGGEIDRLMSRRIAARHGLSHRFAPYRAASAAESADWHARVGHCVGGGNMHGFPTVRALSEFAFMIGGAAGEVGRGFFWRPGDTAKLRIDADALTPRLGLPAHPRLRAAVASWLEGVPAGMDALQLLDLAYLELRVSAWGMAQRTAGMGLARIHPMAARDSLEAMMSLPAEWRAEGRMIREGIRMLWPELLEFPFNRYGDWRDLARPAVRALRDPRLVVKKLRKRFG
ncbi:hypothetical protein [Oceanicella actignis]|uniref:Asparagine synthase (Glutamine-hydrolysing) n=1 Tax=Oceanicella actignis TaxID=1189325 RepID=A0A1M7T403_9RHOB|nr:hypothetical protein [Oceanicella actignis]SET40859.1 hypothetical protein SAMN04488119_104110 [Oceanicella actignis]SHN65438.1 hypothetical protein SAMN05216200_104110 [Oceanicella actignis]